jgi:nitrilase
VAGAQVRAIDAPFGRVGLSVCYDLRFPSCTAPWAVRLDRRAGRLHLHHRRRTGKCCCARAIENQCYVLASAQGGLHPNGRRTWGHSMLIDPWGEVKAVLPEGEGVVSGEIDLLWPACAILARAHRTM